MKKGENMSAPQNPFAPDFDDLPVTLPIFPLSGVLLLPCGQLPLNIFEPRYLAMVEDAFTSDRIIGMVQPKNGEGTQEVFKTGCAGKITEFTETSDGRYLITLTGISRFDIASELPQARGYRKVKADWNPYRDDLKEQGALDLDKDKLKNLLQKYFKKEGMTCDWQSVEHAPDGKLITCLSMVCPFDAREKQALLEAKCGRSRAQMFMTMLEMAVRGDKSCAGCH
jgi:Lon protease-like protein